MERTHRLTKAGLAVLLGSLLTAAVSHAAHRPKSSVLYQTSWRNGARDWTSTAGQWTVRNGVLGFDGRKQSTFLAPYRIHTSRYVLSARIRLVRYTGSGIDVANGFGILFRARLPAPNHYTSGLGAGIVEIQSLAGQTYTAAIVTSAGDPALDNSNTFNYQTYDPGTAWHSYRVEVRGDAIRLSVDGNQLVTVTDSRFRTGTQIGVFSSSSQIQVSSFRADRL